MSQHDGFISTLDIAKWFFIGTAVFVMVVCGIVTAIFTAQYDNPTFMRTTMAPRKNDLNEFRRFLHLEPLDGKHVSVHKDSLYAFRIVAVCSALAGVVCLLTIPIALARLRVDCLNRNVCKQDAPYHYVMVVVIVCCGLVIFGLTLTFRGQNQHRKPSAFFSDFDKYEGVADNADTSVFWNGVMMHDNCCGLASYRDFYTLKWTPKYTKFKLGTNETEVELKKLRLPLVCCTSKTMASAEAGDFTALRACVNGSDQNAIKRYGCFETAMKLIRKLYQEPTILISATIACCAVFAYTVASYVLDDLLDNSAIHFTVDEDVAD